MEKYTEDINKVTKIHINNKILIMVNRVYINNICEGIIGHCIVAGIFWVFQLFGS